MPNWEGSDRASRLPADWNARRVVVLQRDSYACQHVRSDTGRRCGARANEVDHIRNDDDHSYSNLRALCSYHHAQKSGREGGVASGAARRKKRDSRARPHPGLL